jgi:hypothetical protein
LSCGITILLVGTKSQLVPSPIAGITDAAKEGHNAQAIPETMMKDYDTQRGSLRAVFHQDTALKRMRAAKDEPRVDL